MKKKLDIIRSDTKVPHHVPEFIVQLIHDKYPDFILGMQQQAIETIDRVTKGVRIPDHVKTELVGAMNSFYLSGYWHVMQDQLKSVLPKDMK